MLTCMHVQYIIHAYVQCVVDLIFITDCSNHNMWLVFLAAD